MKGFWKGVFAKAPPSTGLKCSCGGELVIRTRKRDGHRFYGCSRFPTCSDTYPLRDSWPGDPSGWPDHPDDDYFDGDFW